MSALPRFRCAQEVGFIPGPMGMERVQFNQEFDYDDRFVVERHGEEVRLPPGPWMDPVNDEAVALVKDLVKQKKRKTVSAEATADTVPVQPPKSGISLSMETQGLHNANVDHAAVQPSRPAPKRRAAPAKAS